MIKKKKKNSNTDKDIANLMVSKTKKVFAAGNYEVN